MKSLKNPVSMLNMALLSIILMVAHIGNCGRVGLMHATYIPTQTCERTSQAESVLKGG